MREAILSARRKLANAQGLDIDLAPIIETAQKREQDAVTGDLAIRTAEIMRLGRGVSSPKIDGELDDELWRKTEPLEPFVPMKAAQETVSAQTETRAAYDDEYLYIAFRCEEPKAPELQIVGETRRLCVHRRRGRAVYQAQRRVGCVLSLRHQPGECGVGGAACRRAATEYNPEWQHGAQQDRISGPWRPPFRGKP